MAQIQTHCPFCKKFICLPSELEKHIKVCPQRSAHFHPSGSSKPYREEGESGIGAALTLGAVASMFSRDDDDGPSSSSGGDDGGSFGGGDFGGGGASDDF